MRILIVTPLFPPDLGRLATYTKSLATHLAGRHTVAVMTYGALPEDVPGVQVICASRKLPTFLRLLNLTWKLWKESRSMDVLYVGDGASVGTPSIFIGWLRGLPVVRFVMEDEVWERTIRTHHTALSQEEFSIEPLADQKLRSVRRLQRWVLRRARMILLPTQTQRDLLMGVYQLAASQLSVAPYPPEPLKVVPFSIERVPFQLLVMSPLTASSGVDLVLQSVSALREHLPELQLVIANEGPALNTLKQQAQALGIKDQVTFLGRISSVERSYLLQSSAILLLTHTGSHLRDEIPHAQIAGIPIIATDTPIHRASIEDTSTGLLIPWNDERALTTAIKRLLQDDQLCQHLTMNAHRAGKKRMDWSDHLIHLEHLFQEVTTKI